MDNSNIIGNMIIPEKIDWNNYELDKPAYEIFVILQRDPTISISQLSEELEYSPTLINSRLESLKKQEFLRPDRFISVPFLGKRLQTDAEAVYEPSTLGLTRMSVFLHEIPTRDELRYLEQLLEIHPYTHYYVTVFGNKTSIFCQFDIPPDASKHLEQLFEILINTGYFRSYQAMTQKYIAESKVDTSKWYLPSNQWQLYSEDEFDSTTMDSELELLWYDFLSENKFKPTERNQPEMVKIDEIDLKLIRELTINAKPNISKLSKHYNISRSRLSRRIKRIREHIIRDVRLAFDQSALDITYAQIITGTFRNERKFTQQTFRSFLAGNYIPFTTQAIVTEKAFIWLIIASPSYIPMITRFAWEHADDIKVYQLDLQSSRTHYFYHKNFSDAEGWNTNKSYIVDDPLQMMKELNIS